MQDLRLSNGEKLPLLPDFLNRMKSFPGLKLVLEIKTHSRASDNERAVDRCISLVRKAGLEDDVVWIAFDYDNCRRIAQTLPEAQVQYLGGDRKPSFCKADGIAGIDYSHFRLKDGWIREAHSLGMTVNVWTVNDPVSMKKFISKGVDFITTDRPDLLQSLLETPFVTYSHPAMD